MTSKKILINAFHEEETRIACVEITQERAGKEKTLLLDYHIENFLGANQTQGNIYWGVIERIEPGLEAAFVRYSENAQSRQGFLPLKDIHPGYFKNALELAPQPPPEPAIEADTVEPLADEEDGLGATAGEGSDPPLATDDSAPGSGHADVPPPPAAPPVLLHGLRDRAGKRINIKDVVAEGTPVLVQVEKEERGNKGAALTTFISLAGSYLVLMPNNPRAGGISKIVEGAEREALRHMLSTLPIPEGMGVIARAACVGKTDAELAYDLEYLLHQWHAIQTAISHYPAPKLIYQEDTLIRAIRDYVHKDTDEIWIDDAAAFEKTKEYLSYLRPECVDRLKLHDNRTPLFSSFGVEHMIEMVYQREIRLPSGGNLVIDRTEALVAIDVNSAQSTRNADIHETALRTNIEAARVIAKQLRLRDLGGLIVIDFIDMSSAKHRKEVEDTLYRALSHDRARIQVGRISRFGLLEMTRQRLRASLGENTDLPCPRCNGTGIVRHIHVLALRMMRLLEDAAIRVPRSTLHLQVPVELAAYLFNERRESIHKIEGIRNCKIVIIPNPHFQTPQYKLTYFSQTGAEVLGIEQETASHLLIDKPAEENSQPIQQEPAAQPLVKLVPPMVSASRIAAPAPGLLKRLWIALFGAKPEPDPRESTKTSRGSASPGKTGTALAPHAAGHKASAGGNRARRNNNRKGNPKTTRRNASDMESLPVMQQPLIPPPTSLPVETQTASATAQPRNTNPRNRSRNRKNPSSQTSSPSAAPGAPSEENGAAKRRNANYLRHGRRHKAPGAGDTGEKANVSSASEEGSPA